MNLHEGRVVKMVENVIICHRLATLCKKDHLSDNKSTLLISRNTFKPEIKFKLIFSENNEKCLPSVDL